MSANYSYENLFSTCAKKSAKAAILRKWISIPLSIAKTLLMVAKKIDPAQNKDSPRRKQKQYIRCR